MKVTRSNGSNRKASPRFSAITFEDSDLDLQLTPLASISNIGNENNVRENLLHPSNSTLNSLRSSLHGSDDDSASEQQSKDLIPSPASSATGNTLLVDNSCFPHPHTDTTLTPEANLNKVSWNPDWQQPTLMVSMLSIGFLLSIGHHVFYNSLDGTIAGGSARQAWSLQVGAAFAFLAVICFRVAIVAALNQLIWKIVKDSALTIGSLDKLFTLATNPFGIFNLCILKSARLAALVGVIFWCMDLMSFAPTATLSVVAKNVSVEVDILVLNSSGFSWDMDAGYLSKQSSPSNRIAWQSAYTSDVVPLPQPVSSPNWSYDLNFFGPSFKCRPADSTEQADFNRVTRALEIRHKIFTATQMDDKYWNLTTHASPLWNVSHGNSSDSDFDYMMDNTTIRDLLFYSSWATTTFREYTYSWWPDIYGTPTNNSGFWASSDTSPFSPKYILLETSTSSIVCSPINASFEITIASIGGRQQITQRGVTPVQKSSLDSNDQMMHDSQFVALASTLAGNATLGVGGWDPQGLSNGSNDLWSFIWGECNIIALGLLACEEFQKSPFISKMSTPNEPNLGIKNLYATCPTQPHQCRNQSILRAIEDLSNNITISYLSSPALTSTEPRNITTSDTTIIYVYRPLFLILSYGIGFLFTSLAAIIGLHSIHVNGVSYSSLFSTILATTRNTDLDALTSGASLGADPLAKNIKETKLKFGPVLGKEGMCLSSVPSCGVPHIAFGLEGTIGDLKKRGQYV